MNLSTESKPAMSKGQLITYIRELNPTAEPQFLEQFDEEALHQYLDQLRAARDRRKRIHTFVRRRNESQRLAS